MSLSISAAASEGQQYTPLLPALASDAPAVDNSDTSDRTNAPIVDTVSIGSVLPDRLATYQIDGSVLHQYQDNEQDSATGTATASTVTYAGGVPADSVSVPELGGEGSAGDGSTTELVNYQSTSAEETANLTNGSGTAQGGVVALKYEGLAITDTEGSAGVSLSSNLSGVKAQSTVGDLTLQLAKALQADTTADPTTGALSLTSDGKTNLINTVTSLLLSKNFTSDEAASGAQSLADSIDGTSKSITLSLQHRGDQTEISGGASPLGDDPQANQRSYDFETADDVNISLDTGTGALGVDLHEHDVDSEETASAQHSDNVAQALATVGPPSFFGAGGQDIASAAGSVLQENASTSRFTSNQSTVSVTLDDGSGSAEFSSTFIQGRLRSQDVGEAAALGQAAQKGLDSISSTVASLFDAVDTPQNIAAADGTDPATVPGQGDAAKTAPALTGTTGLHARISPFITALTNVLQLLQSAKPVPTETGAGTAKATDKGNLQSLSTSQEALNVTATSSKYDDGEQIGENNAFLAALYSKPSAAKPSTKLSV
jgi:hypothetical protein